MRALTCRPLHFAGHTEPSATTWKSRIGGVGDRFEADGTIRRNGLIGGGIQLGTAMGFGINDGGDALVFRGEQFGEDFHGAFDFELCNGLLHTEFFVKGKGTARPNTFRFLGHGDIRFLGLRVLSVFWGVVLGLERVTTIAFDLHYHYLFVSSLWCHCDYVD